MPVPEDAALEKLKAQVPENRKCFDCADLPTTWASVNNGVFLCIKCAGIHRSFGVDISFVRSTTLDTWRPAQIESMKMGGNRRAAEWFDEQGLRQLPTAEARWRAAGRYRSLLKQEVSQNLGLADEDDVGGGHGGQSTTRLANDPKYRNAVSIGSSDFGYDSKKRTDESTCCSCVLL
eukprot:TRINITY_DN31076_c0_g1_i1.p3 TRINITY_DN31076_c0_g1~~TRINITY_DN31076_c0_g1_i1.p3  ORF type:complete len:177 (-),score=35.43 TRINITY_DN31076_c0_g1_i1:215-745(-)